MKNVKMALSALVVFAIVGSALAFTKTNPNLFFCNSSNQCVKATASTFDPGTHIPLTASNFYLTNTSTTPIIDCFRPGSTTEGCSSEEHPGQAWQNN